MLSDGELARAVTAGDVTAESELYRRFFPRLRLLACRHLYGLHDVDDLVQEVMILVLGALRQRRVGEPDKIGAYIGGVLRNKAREGWRNQAARQALLEREHAALPQVAVDEPAVAPARLGPCLERLSERDRSALRLTFWDGADSPAIGAALRMSADHVRVARQRILAALRKCLEERP